MLVSCAALSNYSKKIFLIDFVFAFIWLKSLFAVMNIVYVKLIDEAEIEVNANREKLNEKVGVVSVISSQ